MSPALQPPFASLVSANQRNLLLHCQVFWPDNSAVSQMVSAVAEDAAKAGWRVTVVTSARGYNADETYPAQAEHGGASIHRVGGARFNRHSVAGRLANYLSFIIASGWKLLWLPSPDCLVVTSAPPFSLALAWIMRLFRRVPFVFVAEDLYPEIAVASKILRADSVTARLAGWLFGCWLHRAGAIIVLGEHMKARLLASHPRLDPARVVPIDNWHDGRRLFPLARAAGDRVCVQYSGNFGEGHDFATLVEALQLVKEDARLRFQFVGGGRRRPWLEAEVQQRGLSGCTFHDYVSEAELNQSLNAADVCLVTVARGFEGLLVPSKLYGIMAVGKPVLYYGAPDGDVPALVRRHELGWAIAQGDAAGLARALQEAAADPQLRARLGTNARHAFEAHYDRPLATARYLRVFDGVVANGR